MDRKEYEKIKRIQYCWRTSTNRSVFYIKKRISKVNRKRLYKLYSERERVNRVSDVRDVIGGCNESIYFSILKNIIKLDEEIKRAFKIKATKKGQTLKERLTELIEKDVAEKWFFLFTDYNFIKW